MKKILSVLLAAEIFGTTAFAQDTLSSEKIAWGLGPQTDTVGRPVDAVNAQSEYGEYHALFVGEPDKKNIWLTFDEGYENGCTSRILDILKEKDAKAVFFVTYDYAKDNPELIKRMIAEGHTVGNHTTPLPNVPRKRYAMSFLRFTITSVTTSAMICTLCVRRKANFQRKCFPLPKISATPLFCGVSRIRTGLRINSPTRCKPTSE